MRTRGTGGRGLDRPGGGAHLAAGGLWSSQRRAGEAQLRSWAGKVEESSLGKKSPKKSPGTIPSLDPADPGGSVRAGGPAAPGV